MYQRKDGDKVVDEHSTKQPGNKQTQATKQQRIREQAEQRTAFKKAREEKSKQASVEVAADPKTTGGK